MVDNGINIITEALRALRELDEAENPGDERIIEDGRRAKKVYEDQLEWLEKAVVGVRIRDRKKNSTKGIIRSIDITEQDFEISPRSSRHPYGEYGTRLEGEVTYAPDSQSEEVIRCRVEDLLDPAQDYSFCTVKEILGVEYTKDFKFETYWDNLTAAFNKYRKLQKDVSFLASKSRLRNLDKNKRVKGGFNPFDFAAGLYNSNNPRQVGSKWPEISTHPDWQQWIQDNVSSIYARAPEANGKLDMARDFLGHERVYPSDSRSWSFAIRFEKDKLDECPFKHLLSKDGYLYCVAAVCELFRGKSNEGLFYKRNDNDNLTDYELEFEEEEDVSDSDVN